MRVLLVEDEANIRKLVKLNLDLEGFETDTAENGLIAINKLAQAHYDIVILDLMLPKVNGMEVLTKLRLTNTKVPVIITSAKDTSSDRILGLKQGADDYLVKPFDIEELVLRMNKLIERNQVNTTEKELPIFAFGENTINFSSYMASNGADTFELKPKEFLIMKFLISRKNQVVSRNDILKNVWGYDVFPSTRTIDNFISTLRKYFEKDIKNPQYIRSIRGIGYKFVE